MGFGLLGKGLAVSRSLGDLLFKEPKRLVECEPDVCRLHLTPDCTFVVLGTDGVWDVLTDEDSVSIAEAEIKVMAALGLKCLLILPALHLLKNQVVIIG